MHHLSFFGFTPMFLLLHTKMSSLVWGSPRCFLRITHMPMRGPPSEFLLSFYLYVLLYGHLMLLGTLGIVPHIPSVHHGWDCQGN